MGLGFVQIRQADARCARRKLPSFEDSLVVDGELKERERAAFLSPLILPSARAASDHGKSLALIRPRETRFIYKRKTTQQLEKERQSYRDAAAQTKLFDSELAALEPSPFEFKFRFKDADGMHEYINGDWEAHAMFFHGRQRSQSEEEVLDWMDHTFNVDYPRKGMVFAIGNQAKRPHVWQLLGVVRLNVSEQESLPL